MTAATTITLAEAPGVASVFVLATADPAVVIWPCVRCWDENGRMEMYAHVLGGVCFKCDGFGGAEMTLAAAQVKATRIIKRRVRDAAVKEAARLAKLAARDARIAALVAEHPGLAELLDENVSGYTRWAKPGEEEDTIGWDGEANPPRERGAVYVKPLGDFVYGLAETLRFEPHRMTAKRCEAAVKAIADERAKIVVHEAKLAAAGEVPSGKVAITGTVVAVWEKETHFGYSTQYVTKMRVETTDGWVAIGTAPQALFDAMCAENGGSCDWRNLRGRTISLVATVEAPEQQKEGELPVGFLVRPHRAKLV